MSVEQFDLVEWAQSEVIKKLEWVLTFPASSGNWHVMILTNNTWLTVYWTGSHEFTNIKEFEGAIRAALSDYSFDYEHTPRTEEAPTEHCWDIHKWDERYASFICLGNGTSRHPNHELASLIALLTAYRNMLEFEETERPER